MTFGFPAYFLTTLNLELKKADNTKDIVRKALDSISWKMKEETPTQIIASTNISLTSWAEIITINFLDNNSISIKSKCSLPTQCFDWGKNKKNVITLQNEIIKFSKL